MEGRIDWEEIGRYLAGECTDEGRARVDAWVRGFPERQALIDELRKIEMVAKSQQPEWDLDVAWESMAAKLQQDPRTSEIGIDRPAERAIRKSTSPRRRRAPAKHFIAQRIFVAAVLVLVAAVGFLASHIAGTPEAEARAELDMREVATHKGQRAEIQLSDGTRVLLNVASKIEIPSEFHAEQREITLQGEAYFDVAADPERPFIIRTGNAVVRVVGTAFNVRSYEQDEAVQIVVAEGKVSLQSNSEENPTMAFLTQQQMGLLLPDGSLSVHRDVDLDDYLGWREKRLVFENTPLSEVVLELERWYNLEIHFADASLATRSLSATFYDESMSEILRVVSTSTGLRYERNRRVITLYP